MKHIVGTGLRVAAVAVVVVVGLALLAGKDDIRKFHRMRSM
jgi:type IV secretory pathway VirB2 component (pilin)